MKRHGLLLGAWLGAAVAARAGDDPRALARRGLAEYRAERFAEAASLFEQAARAAVGTKLDPAVPRFNRAAALLRAGRADEAARIAQDAAQTADLALQARAAYNHAAALRAVAAAAEEKKQYAPALESARQALAQLRRSLLLAPGDHDAQVNYELTREDIRRLEKRVEENQQQEKSPQGPQDQRDKQDKQEPQGPQEKQPPQQKPDPADRPDRAERSDPSDQQEPPPAADQPAEEMTPEEAKMMLDALRREENAARENRAMVSPRTIPVEKDW